MVITLYLRVKVQTEMHLQLLLSFIQHLKKKSQQKLKRSCRSRRSAEVSAAEAAAEKCGEGTHLEDGVCMLDESSESETVSANTGSVPTEGFNSWIYSITFTLLIAFVIAISLFLISRVRGKKTV